MQNIQYLVLLIISMLISLSVFFIVKRYNGSTKQIKVITMLLTICTFVWSLSLSFQILLQNSGLPLTLFEGFASFGACFLPILILFWGLTFSRTNLSFKWYYLLLFIIPVVSTVLMFTDYKYHLFYEHYSINLSDTIYGPYFTVHSVFSYTCILIGLLILFYYSIRNAGFFSKQSLLLVLGTLVPTVTNLLGYLGILDATVYLTPVTFSIALSIYAIAIFKFKFLTVAPIALQRIVDRMSDSYLVLNSNNIITDFNQTFLNSFKLTSNEVRNKNIIDLFKYIKDFDINLNDFLATLDVVKKSTETYRFKINFSKIDKSFNVEVNSINSNGKFLATLVLLKDETQHVKDLEIIKSNQELLMERERLASLGQLIGGIAHNLKTPIMSISGATEGLTDLVKEYDSSIDDPSVNSSDHHDIASDMNTWIEKIKTHTSYMSDVITAVKGQAVTLSAGDTVSDFTIEELIKRVNILMKHELKSALVNLNIDVQVDSSIVIKGNVNILVQVINNMISNAIQSYNGTPDKDIDLIICKNDNNIVVKIKDYGCGMPKDVQDKLFKEMITTKGKNGTGLGLFMSYSTIRGNFNGNIKFDSKENVGTTFEIILPL